MPAAPRKKGAPTKIARAVLGVPENQQNKQTKRDKEIQQRLLFNDTRLVR